MVVYGLLTEPGENSTVFTLFGAVAGRHGMAWLVSLSHIAKSFLVRDGIHSVADYNSTWMGVVLVVVVVVLV